MLNYKHLNYFATVAQLGSISKAAERLHLTPQTLSGQLTQFEDRLGVHLFKRVGRKLELTDTGRMALNYAQEIFQIGAELEEALRGVPDMQLAPFRVGIADVVPKTIAQRLLAPLLELPQSLRLICREDRLDRLLADLAIHKLDMVLADRPLPTGIEVKGYSHPLGECAVAFLASPALAAAWSGEFPHCMHGAPLLLPGDDSALRAPLLRWLDRHQVRPRIVAEFDDSALMKAFGQAGAGIFPALAANTTDVASNDGLISLGMSNEIRERFFAITVERKVTHPAMHAVIEGARAGLFNAAP